MKETWNWSKYLAEGGKENLQVAYVIYQRGVKKTWRWPMYLPDRGKKYMIMVAYIFTPEGYWKHDGGLSMLRETLFTELQIEPVELYPIGPINHRS